MNSYQNNSRLDNSDILLIEADETVLEIAVMQVLIMTDIVEHLIISKCIFAILLDSVGINNSKSISIKFGLKVCLSLCLLLSSQCVTLNRRLVL